MLIAYLLFGRAHLNDLENLPVFWVFGLLFVLTGVLNYLKNNHNSNNYYNYNNIKSYNKNILQYISHDGASGNSKPKYRGNIQTICRLVKEFTDMGQYYYYY